MIRFLLLFLLSIILANCSKILDGLNSISDEQKYAESFIGRKIVVDSDTSTIVDYNFVEGFNLYNGKTIQWKIVDEYFNNDTLKPINVVPNNE